VFNPVDGCVRRGGGALCVTSRTHCVAQLIIKTAVAPIWCYGHVHAKAINVHGLSDEGSSDENSLACHLWAGRWTPFAASFAQCLR